MGRKKSLCAYCGQPATTVDHIPPKGLFAKPLPVDLITIPSCEACNVGAAKDDEYLRTVMALRHDTFEHSEASGAAERTLRALSRIEGGGLRSLLFSHLVEVPIITPAGLYFGTTGRYNVDMKRVTRVVERIVRGLYFVNKNERVPENARLTIYPVESIKDWSCQGYPMLRNAIAWAHEAKLQTLPRKVLSYRFRETSELAASVWLVAIYKQCLLWSSSQYRVLPPPNSGLHLTPGRSLGRRPSRLGLCNSHSVVGRRVRPGVR